MVRGTKKSTMTGENQDQEQTEFTEEFAEQIEQPVESIEELNNELEAWKNKAEEYLDGWQRAQAEFANYKKRVEREQSQTNQNAAGSVIRRYLDILDDLERALRNRPQSADGTEWAAGIDLVYRKFLNALEAEGVKVMQADGQEFDPNLHEAISHESIEGVDSGHIIEVVKQGYTLGERVLRPAMVRVAK